MVRSLFVILFLLLLQPGAALASGFPVVTHYRLDLKFHLTQQRVSVIASLSVKNTTEKSIARLPFLLYRLLTVEQVADRNGLPLTFTQDVVPMTDEPSLQVNAVVVNLPSPLRPHDSTEVTLRYNGFVFGYPEVMAYVKDRIDEKYSLLRPDAYAYPLLAEPTFSSSLAAMDTKFTYDVRAGAPAGYRVACGGEFVENRNTADTTTFVFRSRIPTWRIDVAVARFSVLALPDDSLIVYHLPSDSAGARQVLASASGVVRLYTDLFGKPRSYRGYTIIEIPDGWGSQASDYYFLQTAAAFQDSSRVPEVYHEVGHSWNAAASPEVQRCRYFDEAFASYFEALAIRAFRGEAAFEEDMEHARGTFARWAERDRQAFETPIAGYGVKELGRHSYTKGAWSLYVLHRLVGETDFRFIIRNMLTQFAGRTINFGEFQELCEHVSQHDLSRFFREWIYGAESSRLLVDKVPIQVIVRRYEGRANR
jgi:hypothetical protein